MFVSHGEAKALVFAFEQVPVDKPGKGKGQKKGASYGVKLPSLGSILAKSFFKRYTKRPDDQVKDNQFKQPYTQGFRFGKLQQTHYTFGEERQVGGH